MTRIARAAWTYGAFVASATLAVLLASPSKNDFFQFWWAGHLVGTGRSPYDPASWSAALAFGTAAGSTAEACASPAAATCLWIYPPWTAWLFAPTGALDPASGIAVQRIAFVLALAVGAVLWVRFVRASASTTGALLFGFAASGVFVREVVVGHFEGLLLIGTYLLARGLRDARTWPVVAGAMLLALKPHLFIALVPLVLVWLASRRAYRALGVAVFALGALAVVGFASDPRALPALIGGAAAKPAVATATTWGFAARIGGPAATALAAIIVLAAVMAGAIAWRRAASADRAGVLVAAGVGLSLVVTPYLQSYDLVLLFPAVAVALAAKRGPAVAIATVTVIAVTWASYLLELAGDPRAFAATLPAIALAVLAWCVRQRAPAAPASPSFPAKG